MIKIVVVVIFEVNFYFRMVGQCIVVIFIQFIQDFGVLVKVLLVIVQMSDFGIIVNIVGGSC